MAVLVDPFDDAVFDRARDKLAVLTTPVPGVAAAAAASLSWRVMAF